MSDRLDEIRTAYSWGPGLDHGDVSWLLDELERVTAERDRFRDRPCARCGHPAKSHNVGRYVGACDDCLGECSYRDSTQTGPEVSP